MPVALYSFKIDEDGRTRVGHIFLAPNEQEADALQKKHADACPKYGPAFREGKTIDILADVDTLPEADESSLEEFLALDRDEDEDEEDEDEEGDEEETPDPEAED